MASTMQWLEEYEGGRLALSLVFDGFNLVCCTLPAGDVPDDMDALKNEFVLDSALWSGFTTFQGGLMMTGDIGQSIKLYDPSIDPGSIDFTVVDHDDALLQSMLREGNSSGFKTYLTSTVAAGSTSAINVKSTASFPASGTIYIGHEKISYSGKTATTFTGITRAVNSFLATDAGGTGAGNPIAPAHLVQENSTPGPAMSPAVTSYPRTWYGRFVTLLLHVYDPVTRRWSKPSDSRQLWTGRIQSYGDNGDGTITINCKNAMDLLMRPVTGAQWQAHFGGGLRFLSGLDDKIVLWNTTSAAYLVSATMNIPSYTEQLEHDDVARIISEQLASWATGGSLHSGDSVTVDLVTSDNDDVPRYQLTFKCSTAVTGNDKVRIGLHKNVWRLLGFGLEGHEGSEPTNLPSGDHTNFRTFSPTSLAGTTHVLKATLPPIVFFELPTISLVGANDFTPDDPVGTLIEQDPEDIGALATSNLVLAVGNHIYACTNDEFSTGNIRWDLEFDPASPQKAGLTAGWKKISGGDSANPGGVGGVGGGTRLGQASEAPIVRQVWYERGRPAGDLLLRLLLSTGTPGYNHADYDYYEGDNFGLGIPASMVDVDSFKDLNDVQMRMQLNEPTPFYKIAEQVLHLTRRYIVWKSQAVNEPPKMTVVRLSTDTDYGSQWVLDEANKAGATIGNPDRTAVDRTPEGMINRFVLKHVPRFGATSIEQTITVENIASQADYGRRRSVEIEAPDVINAAEVFADCIAPAVAYFSRPLAVATRSINSSLMRMAPGDSCSFSDNNVANPLTGVRGETLYGWVLSTSFNLAAGRGTCQVVFLPEKNPGRTRPWSPSARVDETAGGGGYNAGTKTLTLKEFEFGPKLNPVLSWVTGGDADSSYFEVGQQVHVYAMDDGATPLEWFDEVAARTSTSMQLVSGLAGFDSTKLYVVEARNINDVINQQRNYAFLADDDFSTTYSDPEAYEYGTDGLAVLASPETESSVGMFEPHPTATDAGEPASVHKVAYLAKGLNSLLVKTGPVYINDCWAESDACAFPYGAVVGYLGAFTYLAYTPLYSYVAAVSGSKPLLVRVRYRADTGSEVSISVHSSRTPPPAVGSVVSNEVEVVSASTATTYAWSDEFELMPLVTYEPAAGIYHTWIFVSLSVQDVGNPTPTAWLTGITVREKAL